MKPPPPAFSRHSQSPLRGHRAQLDAAHFGSTIESLSGRSVGLAAVNRQLNLEIIQHKEVEAAKTKPE